MQPDPYAALGVQPTATSAQIRAAYLRTMRANHPDRRPGDEAAAERARRATAAWTVLRDPFRRAALDRARARRQGIQPVDAISLARAVAAAREMPSYSRDRRDFAASFHQACVRVGAGVLMLGLVFLLALG